LIAQNSDLGRETLIDEAILPVLVRLAADKLAENVVRACDLLKALAHTGTYRSELISAGVKDAVERITRYVATCGLEQYTDISRIGCSVFSKSTLSNKSDKLRAQHAARGVISVLNSTKYGLSNLYIYSN